MEDERRAIDRDGAVTLGDVGRLDADGFLYLSDRARDMVISGGVNIYPIEIEACLLELDGVRDVAVFGVPDDAYGEAVAAHVEVDPRGRADRGRDPRPRARPARGLQGPARRGLRRRPPPRGLGQDLQAPHPRPLLAGGGPQHLSALRPF